MCLGFLVLPNVPWFQNFQRPDVDCMLLPMIRHQEQCHSFNTLNFRLMPNSDLWLSTYILKSNVLCSWIEYRNNQGLLFFLSKSLNYHWSNGSIQINPIRWQTVLCDLTSSYFFVGNLLTYPQVSSIFRIVLQLLSNFYFKVIKSSLLIVKFQKQKSRNLSILNIDFRH